MKILVAFTAILILIFATLYSFGAFQGDAAYLSGFVKDRSHITTARALINTQFFWSDIPALGVAHDSQFYNGAVFPNTGYGVALLQVPFHYISNLFSNPDGFLPFSDRLIFLFYGFLCIGFIYFSISCFVKKYNFANWLQKEFLVFAITLAICSHSIFVLMSMYFCVYEANTAYFLLVQISACLSALHYRNSTQLKWLVLTGVCAGLGLMIRPTGFIFVFFWIFVLLVNLNSNSSLNTNRSRLKILKTYLLAMTPFVLFWCYSNYVRSGDVFALGFNNVIPLLPELHAMRFGGNPCFSNIKSFLSFFSVLVGNIFGFWDGRGGFYVNNLPNTLNNCGLIFESADIAPMRAPFIPVWISLGTIAIFVHQFFYKKRYDILASFLAILALLIMYTMRQSGFGARYVADFWPFIIYIWLATAISHDFFSKINFKKIWLLILILLSLSVGVIATDVRRQIEKKDCIAPNTRAQWVNPAIFHREGVAYQLASWKQKNGYEVNYNEIIASKALPVASTRIHSESPILNLAEDKEGWSFDGSVGGISYFYLSLPDASLTLNKNKFELILNTSELLPRNIQVYINGKIIKTLAQGRQTRVPFSVPLDSLFSPMIAVVIEWHKSFQAPGLSLFSAEIKL